MDRNSPYNQPLIRVFVSSVMTTELMPIRRLVFEVLATIPLVAPWSFENSPASSQAPHSLYLGEVQHADILIWLVGKATTLAVQEEIQEALALKKKILVFRLPTDTYEQATEILLEGIKSKTTWRQLDTNDAQNLQTEVRDALYEEILRGYRSKSTTGRVDLLKSLKSQSIARCISCWQAAGLSIDEARTFAEDESIGTPTIEACPNQQRRVIVLLGQMGSGKSLILERQFQRAIHNAEIELDAAIPIRLDAPLFSGSLEKHVRDSSAGLGDPSIQGVAIFIDRVDEVEAIQATRILQESRTIVQTYHNSTVLIASRPTATLAREKEEAVYVPCMSLDAAYLLIERILGHALPRFGTRLQAIKQNVTLPLFAILYATYFREHKNDSFSTGELLADLVRRTLEATTSSQELETILERLGQRYIDWGGRPISIFELNIEDKLDLLLRTGLVIYSGGHALSFPLPMLGQWFAAKSLVNGLVNVKDLVSDRQKLERWHYPLAILVSSFSHDQVTPILKSIVQVYPAFGSFVVREGCGHHALQDGVSFPPPTECKRRLVETMGYWVEGIGPIAEIIAPISRDKTLLNLSVGIDSDRAALSTAWGFRIGELKRDEREKVFFSGSVYSRGYSYRSMQLGKQSTWAWQVNLDELSTNLGEFMRVKEFPMDHGPLYDELIWRDAMKIMDNRSIFVEAISVQEILGYIAEIKRFSYDSVNDIPKERIGLLEKRVTQLQEYGKTELKAPYPGADLHTPKGGGWVWNHYSQDQMLRRARVVYQNAYLGYRQLIERWFPCFANQLAMSLISPSRVVGSLSFEDNGEPSLSWYLEPVNDDTQVAVEINIDSFASWPTEDLLQTLIEKYSRFRQERDLLPALFHNDTLDFASNTPATDLAYAWLWHDLDQAGFVSGMLQNRRL